MPAVCEQYDVVLSSPSEPLGVTTGLYPSVSGVWITEVDKHSAAGRAGLCEGQRIVSVNSEDVTSQAGLRDIVARAKASGNLALSFAVDESIDALTRSDNVLSLRKPTLEPIGYRIEKNDHLSTGLQFSEMHDASSRWLEVTGCVFDSPAAHAGVTKGELLAVNEIFVASKDDVIESLQLSTDGTIFVEIAPFEMVSRTVKIDPPADPREDLGLMFKADENGVRIIKVNPHTAAERAGIQAFRHVFSVNGQRPPISPDSVQTGRDLSTMVNAARTQGPILLEIEATPEEIEADLLAKQSLAHPKDKHGYFWVSVPGKDEIFTVQLHHLCLPGGRALSKLPRVGDEVQLSGLSGSEMRLNGLVGRLQVPGEMKADEFVGDEKGAVPMLSQLDLPVQKRTPATWTYNAPPSSKSVVNRMFSSRGKPSGGSGIIDPRDTGKKDWQAWIVKNHNHMQSQKRAARGNQVPQVPKHVPVVLGRQTIPLGFR